MLKISALRTELDTDYGVVRAIEALDLALERGETFALVGESGCGKSMTALSILRLLPENGRVTQGAVDVEGLDIVQLPEARMRDVRGRRIGIIFQEPATSLNPVVTVGRQIVEVIERHTPLRGGLARAKAIDWLTRVGIPDPAARFDAYPFQMSGGQKQRVMIAIALAAEPDLLIADEPTTALDVTIQKQILDLLADLQRERRMAMLLITHDLGIVASIAHRIALMYAGQILEVATVQDFFARPLHPYAQMLFAALPDTVKRGQTLAAIPGTVPPLNRGFAGCRFVERCPWAMEECQRVPPDLLAPHVAGVLADHRVRCLLYRGAQAPKLAETAAASGVAPEARVADTVRAAGAAPVLEIRDYRVWFPLRSGVLKRTVGYFKAVDGISLALHAGRTLALVGESGCGKTTTGKAVVQLLRGTAQISGQALLSGAELDQLDGAALLDARRRIQIIFQDPYASLNPRMRVADILEEGLIALRPEIEPGARRERVQALLQKVGLRADAADRYPHEFSGGQRQRIAIARALAVEPQVIVCDEPTSALDVSVQAQILNLLAQLQRELGVAYFFITHNFAVVEYLADEIAVMQAGRIVERGAARDVLENPQHTYTRTLLAAVPRVTRAAA
jgi:peptide/nickel transport system ATP-binding protein